MDWHERARIARDRMAAKLATDDHPYPEFAAALLVARGSRGMTLEQFAALTGVEAVLLRRLEDGDASPSEAPATLVSVADEPPPELGDASGA